ncbi:MAG: nucleotidyltransferase family protein [Nitriliruptoraceae bacterium]
MTSQPTADAVAIVLAAGSGRRFGGPGALKQLASFEGRPLVVHAVEVARAAGIERVIVVVGPRPEDVATVLIDHDVEVVVNEEHASGQASSLAAGLRAADDIEAATVAVVLLADQPGIAPHVVTDVVATTRERGLVSRARYDDGPGHPVALPRDRWDWIAGRVTGDAGVRQLLGELDVVDVPVDGLAPPDVDTPQDLDTHGNSPGT